MTPSNSPDRRTPTKKCLTDGCDEPRHARGWCANHYAYFRNRGVEAAYEEWEPRGGTCSVEGCDRKHYAKTWCKMHYWSWWKSGTVPTEPLTMRRDRTLRERLDQRTIVNSETGCWEWQGSLAGKGYGHLHWQGRLQKTHRLGYELLVGPIPDGLHIHHECRVRHCWNPEHLRAIAPEENRRLAREQRKLNRT